MFEHIVNEEVSERGARSDKRNKRLHTINAF